MLVKTGKNRVDELLEEIERIQYACGHKVSILIVRPRMRESLVKGVFIVEDTREDVRCAKEGTVKCRDCSREGTIYANKVCLRCIETEGKLVNLEASPWLEERQKYFGRNCLGYAARAIFCISFHILLKSCPRCGFRVVVDEVADLEN